MGDTLVQKKRPQLLVSPVSRKSPWINFGFKKVKLERNADNSGREFWAWIFWVAWNPGKTRPKNSLSKFAIKICWEIRRQFSKIRRTKKKKIHPKSALHNVGANNWGHVTLFDNRFSARRLLRSFGALWLGVALEQETLSRLSGHLPKRLLAPSPIDLIRAAMLL